MATKPLVVLDYDDTLNRMRDTVYETFARRGMRVPPNHWHTYSLETIFKKPEAELLDIFIEDQVLERTPAESSASDLINTLKARGFRVEIWTARAWHPRGKTITEQTIHRDRLNVDGVRYSNLKQSKADLIRPEDRIAAFVDDNLGHVMAMRSACAEAHCLLIDRPWNRDGSPRIWSIDAIPTAVGRPVLLRGVTESVEERAHLSF